MIYLDNASTTQIDTRVLDAMMPYLTNEFGNPGTIYGLGRTAREAVENARLQVAQFIGAKPEQVIFTSGGTESNNMVFTSLYRYLRQTDRTTVITAANEHTSVLESARNLCKHRCFDLVVLPVNEKGCVEFSALRNELDEDIGLVSIMYMNNETGSENPIESIGELCSSHGILFHTDCVQAAGCCKLDAGKMKCDFMSLSSHKIHGPKGVGALFVKHPNLLTPMIRGGANQEFGLRGGTENVAGIVGFGAACELMGKYQHDIDVHTSMLKQVFYNRIEEKLAEYHLNGIVHVNGDSVMCHGKTLNLRFDGVDGETLLLMLDSQGVCVSAGSACHSRESKPSHVLLAMGIGAEDARNSIRISFSKMNSESETKQAADIMASCVSVLHK